MTDDDELDAMGDVALDVVTSHHYSAAHPETQRAMLECDLFRRAVYRLTESVHLRIT